MVVAATEIMHTIHRFCLSTAVQEFAGHGASRWPLPSSRSPATIQSCAPTWRCFGWCLQITTFYNDTHYLCLCTRSKQCPTWVLRRVTFHYCVIRVDKGHVCQHLRYRERRARGWRRRRGRGRGREKGWVLCIFFYRRVDNLLNKELHGFRGEKRCGVRACMHTCDRLYCR